MAAGMAPSGGGGERRAREGTGTRVDRQPWRARAAWRPRGAMRVVSYVSAGAGAGGQTRRRRLSAGAWRVLSPTAGARVATDIRLRRRPDFNLGSV